MPWMCGAKERAPPRAQTGGQTCRRRREKTEWMVGGVAASQGPPGAAGGRRDHRPPDCRGPALPASGSQTSGLSAGRGYISTVASLPSLGTQDMKAVLHRQSTESVTQVGCTWEGSPRRP